MRFQTAAVVLAIFCLAWLMGCADVSSTGPTPPEFNSEYRFLNAAPDLGSVNIAFDLGPAVSGLDFATANSHQAYPSGNRLAVLSNSDSLRVAFTSDQRATVVILPMTGTTREFVKLVERRLIDSATTTNGRLRVVNTLVSGSAEGPAVDVTVAGADTTVSVDGLAYRGDSGYLALPSGNYTVSAVASGDSTVIVSTSITLSNARSTSVLVGDAGSGASAVNLTDN